MEGKRFAKLSDVEAYKLAYHLSNYGWEIVIQWQSFEKDTLGKQLVRALDSISANIAEGFGRYSKKDKIRFYRIARGSLYECLDFNEKARTRGLLSEEQYAYLLKQLQLLPKAINALIKYTNQILKE